MKTRSETLEKTGAESRNICCEASFKEELILAGKIDLKKKARKRDWRRELGSCWGLDLG